MVADVHVRQGGDFEPDWRLAPHDDGGARGEAKLTCITEMASGQAAVRRVAPALIRVGACRG